MEVFLVDGKSDDGTVSRIKKAMETNKEVKFIVNEKRITPAGLNLGIKNSSGRYIALIVAHTQIEKDYLTTCLDAINKTGADSIGGPCRAKGTSYIGKAIALGFQSPFSCGGAKSHKSDYEGHTDTVSNGFYKREIFDKIGFFDEDFIRNHDDELHYRLTKNKGRIWQSPSIRYSYICRDSIKALFRQYWQYGYWKAKIVEKHKLPASLRHIVPGVFVGTLLLFFALSIFFKMFFWAGLLLSGLYFLLNLSVSIITCLGKGKIKYLPVMPVIFAAFHFGYGLGFFKGFFDFIILKREKRKIEDAPLTR